MRKLAALLFTLLLVSACRPLYLPPLLEGAEPEVRSRLELTLNVKDGRPVLALQVLSVAKEGWLAVQWFTPGGREVASESVWLDSDSVGLRFTLPLPSDVEPVPGEWRALLSQHSVVIRQLSVTVD